MAMPDGRLQCWHRYSIMDRYSLQRIPDSSMATMQRRARRVTWVCDNMHQRGSFVRQLVLSLLFGSSPWMIYAARQLHLLRTLVASTVFLTSWRSSGLFLRWAIYIGSGLDPYFLQWHGALRTLMTWTRLQLGRKAFGEWHGWSPGVVSPEQAPAVRGCLRALKLSYDPDTLTLHFLPYAL